MTQSPISNPQSLLLYYFTGTGNTYRAATWLRDAAQARGLDAKASPIDGARPSSEITGTGQLVGLLSPTHAFCAPWAMLHFTLKLPRGNGAAAFTMLTRAGMKVGSWYAPGLEGSGAYLLALILALKGYRVRGVMGLDMPVSWTALVPGVSAETARDIMEHAKPRALGFLDRILGGQTAFWSIIPLLFGLLLLPITCLYLVMGRFFLAKLFYASDKCDGCGLCARSCPVQAIRMVPPVRPNRPRRFQQRPYWTFLCESCTRCMNFCPRKAVEASYPFGAIAVFVTSIPVSAALLDALARWLVNITNLRSPLMETIIAYPYKLLSIFAAYLVFSLVLRVLFLNRLLTLATPTHYYRRYREPETKLKEIIKP